MTQKEGELKLKTYVGMKIIKAIPMTQEDAYFHIGKIPANDKEGKTEGYLIGYPNIDGETFDGALVGDCHYLSWSPKAVFDGVYKSIKV